MVVDDRAKKFLSAKLKTSKTDAVGFSQQADDKLERLFIKRFSRLVPVRRFIILWTCLFVLLFIATFFQLRSLGKYYQTLQPVAGGFYNEGIIGKFTTANPLYATGSADTAVSRTVSHLPQTMSSIRTILFKISKPSRLYTQVGKALPSLKSISMMLNSICPTH
jgi:hypothetical protein